MAGGLHLLTGFLYGLVVGSALSAQPGGAGGQGGNERTQTESLGGRIQGFRHNVQEKEKHERRTFLKDEILLGAENRGVGRRDGQTEEGEGWTERGQIGERRDLPSFFQVSG